MKLAIGIILALTTAASSASSAQTIIVVARPTTQPADVFPANFDGHLVDMETQKVTQLKRDDQAVLFPNIGKPLSFTLEASGLTEGEPRTVRIDGKVIDFNGAELQKVTLDLAVKPGEGARQAFTIQPVEAHAGPFYLIGTWQEVGGEGKGEFIGAVAQSNLKLTIDDFELLRYPKPGEPLGSSASAKKRGEMGLIVRLRKPPPVALQPGQRPPEKPPIPMTSLPLERELPGRAVKIGFWIKSTVPASVTMDVRDRGVEARQSKFYDRWEVGPVSVPAGDWQYVEVPMPGFGRPKAQLKPHGESGGVVDYPLTVLSLKFQSESEGDLLIDDLECWSQGERETSLYVRAVSSKPTGLLYRTDTLNLAIANGWLWGDAIQATYSASFQDAIERKWPLASGNVTIPPGGEVLQPAKFENLALGPYELTAEVKLGDGRIVKPEAKDRFIVYEPTGKPLDAVALHELLGNRHRLLMDLGFTADDVMANWHSIDGAPAVEPFPGVWTFDWIDPDIHARRAAGLEVRGTLGLCALWADPGAVFNPYTNAWNGSVYVMPSRQVYWEEYVQRTVEHYKGIIDTWIVWDRPDAEVFNATAQEYAEKMLEVAHKSATEVNPNVKLISGGFTRENMEKYLVGMSEAGAHHYLHGIGILPSPAPLSPEDGYMDVLLSRAQRIREQEHIKPELWVLELGWPTGDMPSDVSELEQAMYIARAWVLCRSQGIKQIYVKADRTQVSPRRNSADVIFPDGKLTGLKPAALATKTVRAQLHGAEFVREIFLNDRSDGIARAFLFKHSGGSGSRPTGSAGAEPSKELADGKLLLIAWRLEGQSILPLPSQPAAITDTFGNTLPLATEITLRPTPQYVIFSAGDADALARTIERTPLRFEDAPESKWKGQYTFHLDVGTPADETTAQYKSADSRVVGPIDSYYHTEYGRHAVDSGQHFKGEETFVIDVSAYGDADLMLRRRINYAVPNQLVKVFCNDQEIGQWFAFKRDRRHRWRDIEFVIPNRFFAGQSSARIKVVAQNNTEATSYYYWACPIRTRTIYASDLSMLVNTSGYGPGVNRDKNILGGPIRFYQKDEGSAPGGGKTYAKGIGTNAAGSLPASLVVLPLNKQFSRFRATIGVDAATNGRGSVRFRIGDGTKNLFDSQDMNYYSGARDIDVDVSDAILLMLWVDDTGDGHLNDIANWADARLELK